MGILKPYASEALAPDAADAAQPEAQLPTLMAQHLAAERSAHGQPPQRQADAQAAAGARRAAPPRPVAQLPAPAPCRAPLATCRLTSRPHDLLTPPPTTPYPAADGDASGEAESSPENEPAGGVGNTYSLRPRAAAKNATAAPSTAAAAAAAAAAAVKSPLASGGGKGAEQHSAPSATTEPADTVETSGLMDGPIKKRFKVGGWWWWGAGAAELVCWCAGAAGLRSWRCCRGLL
jgi:hypothetical protein